MSATSLNSFKRRQQKMYSDESFPRLTQSAWLFGLSQYPREAQTGKKLVRKSTPLFTEFSYELRKYSWIAFNKTPITGLWRHAMECRISIVFYSATLLSHKNKTNTIAKNIYNQCRYKIFIKLRSTNVKNLQKKIENFTSLCNMGQNRWYRSN